MPLGLSESKLTCVGLLTGRPDNGEDRQERGRFVQTRQHFSSRGDDRRGDRRSEPRQGPSGLARRPPRRVSVDGHTDSHDGSGADQGN